MAFGNTHGNRDVRYEAENDDTRFDEDRPLIGCAYCGERASCTDFHNNVSVCEVHLGMLNVTREESEDTMRYRRRYEHTVAHMSRTNVHNIRSEFPPKNFAGRRGEDGWRVLHVIETGMDYLFIMERIVPREPEDDHGNTL